MGEHDGGDRLHAEHLRHLSWEEIGKRAVVGETSIVDQHVDRNVADRRDDRLDSVCCRQVRGNRAHGDLGVCRGEFTEADVVAADRDQVVPIRSQSIGERPTDSGGRAGDKCDLAHLSSPFEAVPVFRDASSLRRCALQRQYPDVPGGAGPPRTVVVVRSLVSMDDQNLLGAYLRARRELVSPEQVGIAPVGIRRVPGLRREEVALLAGISADYYLRLEQGRDRSPSRQVLDALARVLHLDDEGTADLQSPADPRPHRTRKRPRPEVVPRGIHALISTLDLPAFVEGRYLDVLAANSAAAALSPCLVAGRNRLRDVFLDPGERELYGPAELVTAAMVAGFRSSVGLDVEDERFVELVGSLSIASPRFRTLWARQDVVRREGAVVTLAHPEVGDLTLYREKLPISGADGQMLVIYHPEPASDDAQKLMLLISAAMPAASDPGGRSGGTSDTEEPTAVEGSSSNGRRRN